MARAIKQYRFYSENDANHNQPFNISIENLVNGNIFDSPSCYPILQLFTQPPIHLHIKHLLLNNH